MPTYRITGPDGRKFKVRGDAPPSETELEDIFAGMAGGAPERPAQPPAAAPAPEGRSTLADVAIGAAKGLGNTAIGLGEMVHRIPGVSRAVDAAYGAFDELRGAEPVEGLSERAFPAAREEVRPTNTAQTAGFAGEQIAEHFLPIGAVGKVARVGQAAATTLAQSGNAGTAGV